ncbi:MAG: citrate/2-methylcitrate synthase [Enhygromyxa sp.]
MTTKRLKTRVAMNGWDDHRFQGYAIYADLLGRTTTSQLLALSLGMKLSHEEGQLLDEMIVSSALADPHIWPLKLTRVAGAYGGSIVTGLAAGLLSAEGPVTGAGPVTPMAQLLYRLGTLDSHAAIRDVHAMLDAGQRLPGFGVAARKVDERVVAISRCVVARGRDTQRYWRLWTLIAEQTRSRGVEPNIASAFTAAALDLGFPPERVEPLFLLALLPCFLPNAVEGAEQQPEVLQSLPSDDLEYLGHQRRASSRATFARS